MNIKRSNQKTPTHLPLGAELTNIKQERSLFSLLKHLDPEKLSSYWTPAQSTTRVLTTPSGRKPLQTIIKVMIGV